MARVFLDNDVELDEYLHGYLKDTVQTQVRTILEHQLKDIVAGELARLKLLNENESAGVESCVQAALDRRIAASIGVSLPGLVAQLVAQHVKTHFQRAASGIKA